MAWSKKNRQLHRWTSITFLAIVLVCFIAAALGAAESAVWVFYLPLPPLFVLMGTGLYMFVQPYRAKGRSTPAV